MGWAQLNGDKYTPAYRVNGKKRTCGPKSCGISFTIDQKREAEAHADACEAKAVTSAKAEQEWRERNPDPKGRLSPTQKAVLTVEQFWPRYQKFSTIEPGTLQHYDVQMRCRVLDFQGEPRFRSFRLNDITREDIDIWVADMRRAGESESSIRAAILAFSSVLTLAGKHGILIHKNPLHGIDLPKPERIKQDDEFELPDDAYERLLEAMPTTGLKLLTIALAVTGGRYEEGCAFKVEDTNVLHRTQHIRRRVTWTAANEARGHDGGEVIYENTKNKSRRQFAVQQWYVDLIDAWIRQHGLAKGDVLFQRRLVLPSGRERKSIDDSGRPDLTPEFIATLGYTDRNEHGQRYRHGTLSAVTRGHCKCEHCGYARRLWAREHRARQGQRPRRTTQQPATSPYLNYSTYLYHFTKAVKKTGLEAELGWKPTPHCLRHTNITKMAANGVDIFTMQNRTGHRDLKTLRKYVHQQTEADRRAAEVTSANLRVDPDLLAG